MNDLEHGSKRRAALMLAATAGLACCAFSLIDARVHTMSALFSALSDDGPKMPAPPHHMRGWTHSPPVEKWWPVSP